MDGGTNYSASPEGASSDLPNLEGGVQLLPSLCKSSDFDGCAVVHACDCAKGIIRLFNCHFLFKSEEVRLLPTLK